MVEERLQPEFRQNFLFFGRSRTVQTSAKPQNSLSTSATKASLKDDALLGVNTKSHAVSPMFSSKLVSFPLYEQTCKAQDVKASKFASWQAN